MRKSISIALAVYSCVLFTMVSSARADTSASAPRPAAAVHYGYFPTLHGSSGAGKAAELNPRSGTVTLPLQTNVTYLQKHATLIGPHSTTSTIRLTFSLKLRNLQRLKSFLNEVQDSGSPQYRHFLTPEQFTRQYGPSQADVNTVTSYLAKSGIQVTGVSRNHVLIHTEAPTGVYEHVMEIGIRDYKMGTREFYSSVDRPRLPMAVASLVQNVIGLNNAVLMRPSSHMEHLHSSTFGGETVTPAAPPPATSAYFNPAQIATAYDWPSITDSANGSGVSVAILTAESSGLATNPSPTDFWSGYGLPGHAINVIPVDGDVGSTSGMVETLLDIEWSGAMAPGITQNVYVASTAYLSTFADMYNKFVNDDTSQVMTTSWGAAEVSDPPIYKTDEEMFMQGAAEGISMFAAAGDNGASDCSSNFCPPGDDNADFPSSSAYITSANGTELTTNVAGDYVSETAWSGSGGGTSVLFTQPSWQHGTGVPFTGYRMNSDMAMNAGGLHPYVLNFGGRWYAVYGTSAVAPQLAALFAIGVSKQPGGASLGQSNELIYNDVNAGNYSTDFHDVTTGNNGTYQAGVGWDHPTGWGSPRATSLLSHIGVYGPAGTLSGTVTDAATGATVAGATVVINPGNISLPTAADGTYSRLLAAGSYTVTAKNYPEISSPASVTITNGQTTTQNLSLQRAPLITVSGKVSDAGQGTGTGAHGWPLYADVEASTLSSGKVGEAFTDPMTGDYSMQLAQGFSYAIKAQAHSDYQEGDVELSQPTKDVVENFTLPIDAACDALGYGDNYGQNFNKGTPPFGWRVVNNIPGSPVVWGTNANWQETNVTGGSGMSASADSYAASLLDGYNGSFDTSLVSAAIPVSSLPSNPVLNFLLNYQEFSGNDALDVDINVDGTGWTTMEHITKSEGTLYNLPGANESIDLSSYIPSGAQSIQLRWHYYDLTGNVDWYAQIDDVTIGTCHPVPGGLILGQVSNVEKQAPIIGAAVYDDLYNLTNSFATPNDPAYSDLYLLFSPSGKRTISASGDNLYASTTINIVNNSLNWHDFPLGNADLAITSATGKTLNKSEQGDLADVVVTNNGPDTAVGATLRFSPVDSLLFVSGTSSQGTCSSGIGAEAGWLICSLGDLSSGQSVRVQVTGIASQAGSMPVHVAATEEDNDPDTSNNDATPIVTIKAPPQSGGGSFGILGLLGLMALALVMVMMRRFSHQSLSEKPRGGAMSRFFNCNTGFIGLLLIAMLVLVAPSLARAQPAQKGNSGINAAPAGLVQAMLPWANGQADRLSAYRIDRHHCAKLSAQHLGACFEHDDGVAFARTHQKLTLQLLGWGRSQHLRTGRFSGEQVHGNRVSYRDPRGLRGWWQVLPIGYEQGFTARAAPPGHGKLVIELRASKAPTVADDSELSWGPLHYGKLYVSDAAGRSLPATLRARGRVIQIEINDKGARYPLTIDPLVWVTQRVMSPNPAPKDQFGQAVTLSRTGTVAIVGGGNQAYVYTKENGVWNLQTQLVPTPATSATITSVTVGSFGSNVALNANGTEALIGAPYTSINGGYLNGAAFVFEYANGAWTQTAQITAPGHPGFTKFGVSGALDSSGNVALIGATFGGGGFLQGEAFFFSDTGGTWTKTARFTTPKGTPGMFAVYGAAVALNSAGTRGLVTAEEQYQAQGAAYVYDYANGAWSYTTQLIPSNGHSGYAFGSSASLDGTGNVALVGAFSYPGYTSHTGAGFIFTDNSGTWTQSAKLIGNDEGNNDQLGVPNGAILSLSGDTALLGAPGHNPIPGSNPYGIAEGAAYLFSNVGGSWQQTGELAPSGDPTLDRTASYGWSVAMAGDNIVVGGSHYYANFTQPGPGAAYFSTASNLALALDSPKIVQPGTHYDEQATVTNSSASVSGPITAFVPVPPESTFIAATSTQGNCTNLSSGVSCSLGGVSGNAGAATVSVTLEAPSQAAQIDNEVTLQNTHPVMSALSNMEVGPAPSISGLSALTLKSSESGIEEFSIGGTGALVTSVTSGDASVLPASSVSGAAKCTKAGLCKLTVNPAKGKAGVATMTVTVSDATGETAAGNFTVKVTSSSSTGGGGSFGLLSLLGILMLGICAAAIRRDRTQQR